MSIARLWGKSGESPALTRNGGPGDVTSHGKPDYPRPLPSPPPAEVCGMESDGATYPCRPAGGLHRRRGPTEDHAPKGLPLMASHVRAALRRWLAVPLTLGAVAAVVGLGAPPAL